MQRRAFVAGMAATMAAVAAHAQERKVPRIGWLSPARPSLVEQSRKAFDDGLRDLGWIEGQNIVIERRYAEYASDRLPALCAELIRLKVDAIVAAGGNHVIQAVRDATSTIPIVMVSALDPAGQRFISSLRRPGGNITGSQLGSRSPYHREVPRATERGRARTVKGWRHHRLWFGWRPGVSDGGRSRSAGTRVDIGSCRSP
jgi:ABC transporter substrate binding protein